MIANACFDAQWPHRQDLLPPTLRYLTYVDQQINIAQVSVDHAYQAEDTLSWFLPGKKGDHDLRLGLQYEYVWRTSTPTGNLNGTFLFHGNEPVRSRRPAHLSRAPEHPRAAGRASSTRSRTISAPSPRTSGSSGGG